MCDTCLVSSECDNGYFCNNGSCAFAADVKVASLTGSSEHQATTDNTTFVGAVVGSIAAVAAADLLLVAGACFWPGAVFGLAVAVEVVYAVLTVEGLFVGVGGADVGREEEGLCLSQVRKNKIRRKGCGCII